MEFQSPDVRSVNFNTKDCYDLIKRLVSWKNGTESESRLFINLKDGRTLEGHLYSFDALGGLLLVNVEETFKFLETGESKRRCVGCLLVPREQINKISIQKEILVCETQSQDKNTKSCS